MFPFRIYYCACLRWFFCHHNTPYVICHTCHRLSPLIRGLPSPKHKDVWELRPASHTRLRAHDHCTSSTLIGGKGWAGPSSLHTTLEGPTECVCVCARARARWMYGLHGFLHGTEWIMFHGHLDYFQNPSLGGRLDTKLGDHDIPNAHNHWFVLF